MGQFLNRSLSRNHSTEIASQKCFNTSTSTILIARPAQYNELYLSPTLYDSTSNHQIKANNIDLISGGILLAVLDLGKIFQD